MHGPWTQRLKAMGDLVATLAMAIAAIVLIWRTSVTPARPAASRSELPMEDIKKAELATSIADAPRRGAATAGVVLI